jgi:hypothetical protein
VAYCLKALAGLERQFIGQCFAAVGIQTREDFILLARNCSRALQKRIVNARRLFAILVD